MKYFCLFRHIYVVDNRSIVPIVLSGTLVILCQFSGTWLILYDMANPPYNHAGSNYSLLQTTYLPPNISVLSTTERGTSVYHLSETDGDDAHEYNE